MKPKDLKRLAPPREAADGSRVAAGVTNYASAELRQIRGLRSDRIAETLGYAYGDEVVHRDNLVLL